MNGRALLIFASFALFSDASSNTADNSFEGCLKKDSISCLQIHVYNKLKAILSSDRIDLLGGLRIVKDETGEGDTISDTDLLRVNDTLERQILLEKFIYDKVVGFFKCRSLQWSMEDAMKGIVPHAWRMMDKIPRSMKEKVVTIFNEGRGKKKLFKWLLPFIIAIKATLLTWGKIALIAVTLLAKKALAVSVIALTIAILLVFKKHQKKDVVHPHYEIHGEAFHSPFPYYAPVNRQPIQHGYYDTYDLHSSPSHHLAYSSQKPGVR